MHNYGMYIYIYTLYITVYYIWLEFSQSLHIGSAILGMKQAIKVVTTAYWVYRERNLPWRRVLSLQLASSAMSLQKWFNDPCIVLGCTGHVVVGVLRSTWRQKHVFVCFVCVCVWASSILIQDPHGVTSSPLFLQACSDVVMTCDDKRQQSRSGMIYDKQLVVFPKLGQCWYWVMHHHSNITMI